MDTTRTQGPGGGHYREAGVRTQRVTAPDEGAPPTCHYEQGRVARMAAPSGTTYTYAWHKAPCRRGED